MSTHNEKILLFLKFSHNQVNKQFPLRHGPNFIPAELIPEAAEAGSLLFTVFLFNKNEALLRTFSHFPLSVKFLKEDERENPSDEEGTILVKQTLIKINSILKIQIFPLKNLENNFFSFALPEEIEKKCNQEIQNKEDQIEIDEKGQFTFIEAEKLVEEEIDNKESSSIKNFEKKEINNEEYFSL
jgi:hypothetical protein